MNIIPELNLARKWRPSTFEAVVGQELTVRLLKNSLFKQQFFPVYLLAGQRGCGKTTTGRIFAAAVNCEQLDAFSHNPRVQLPCATCRSCIAMRQGNHPDFIEIDAASHTGVDNVRQIIEATSFLPHLGRKKIYLIDEAHMLSKAAFNAFLKILEEPPKTVLFMMATTDPHKIIDTVRSRCFQLFFDPVSDHLLTDHLAQVCEHESLSYEREALALIVRESEGSVRDALNMVERVRLAHEGISKQAVMSLFGSWEDEAVVELVAAVAQENPAEIYAIWKKYQCAQRSAAMLWKKLFDCLHACITIAYVEVSPAFKPSEARLREIGKQMAGARLVHCMELMYSFEQQFIKTANPHAMLEILLLKMCMGNTPIIEQRPVMPQQPVREPARAPEQRPTQQPAVEQRTVARAVTSPAPEIPAGPASWWGQFVSQIDTVGDPLFASMIKQGQYQQADATGSVWQVALPKDLAFFQDTIEKHAPAWKKLVAGICQKAIDIQFHFTLEKTKTAEPAKLRPAPAASMPVARSSARPGTEQKKPVDVSDAAKWEKTHTILAMFPGAVSAAPETELPESAKNTIQGSTHE